MSAVACPCDLREQGSPIYGPRLMRLHCRVRRLELSLYHQMLADGSRPVSPPRPPRKRLPELIAEHKAFMAEIHAMCGGAR